MPDQETPLPLTLDRVWAATRPADLSSDEFDQIWAKVTRADKERRATVLPFTRAMGRRPLTVASLCLAQVAAVLAIVFLVPWGSTKEPTPGPTPPSDVLAPLLITIHDLKVEADEVVMVMVEDEGQVDYQRTLADSGPSMALNDVPSVNPNDLLNHWETLAQ